MSKEVAKLELKPIQTQIKTGVIASYPLNLIK
jgi:hypothetical protein